MSKMAFVFMTSMAGLGTPYCRKRDSYNLTRPFSLFFSSLEISDVFISYGLIDDVADIVVFPCPIRSFYEEVPESL